MEKPHGWLSVCERRKDFPFPREFLLDGNFPHGIELVFKAYVSHKANEANKYGLQFCVVQTANRYTLASSGFVE